MTRLARRTIRNFASRRVAFRCASVVRHDEFQNSEIRAGCCKAATRTRRQTRVSALDCRDMLWKWRGRTV